MLLFFFLNHLSVFLLTFLHRDAFRRVIWQTFEKALFFNCDWMGLGQRDQGCPIKRRFFGTKRPRMPGDKWNGTFFYKCMFSLLRPLMCRFKNLGDLYSGFKKTHIFSQKIHSKMGTCKTLVVVKKTLCACQIVGFLYVLFYFVISLYWFCGMFMGVCIFLSLRIDAFPPCCFCWMAAAVGQSGDCYCKKHPQSFIEKHNQ